MKRKTQKIPKHIKKFLRIQTSYNISHYNAKTGIRRNPEDVWKRIPLSQFGGEKKTYKISDYVFLIDKEESTIISYSKKGLPCFKITFSPEDGTILIDISYFSDCAHNIELPKSTGTILMFKLILHIIMTREDIDLYNIIELTDNSAISINYNEENLFINLANMYFICTGCTWYSSFIPIFLKDYRYYIKFINDREKILGPNALSWIELLNKLPENIKKIFESFLNEDTNIDLNKKGSARYILNYIREQKKFSFIYNLYEVYLLEAFNISSLIGKIWCLPLKDGKIIMPNFSSSEYECMNKTKKLIPEILIQYMDKDEYDILRREIQKEKIYTTPIKIEKLDI